MINLLNELFFGRWDHKIFMKPKEVNRSNLSIFLSEGYQNWIKNCTTNLAQIMNDQCYRIPILF